MNASDVARNPHFFAELIEEGRKIPAFFRRDFLTLWSYRLAFFSDWANLAIQVLLFTLIGSIVDPDVVPSYGGRQVGYVEFVAVGIAVMAFVQVALTRMVSAIRREQMIGTLEAVLATPIRPFTFQLGSVMFDLVYVPLRTALFLVLSSVFLAIELHPTSWPAALLVLMVFIPFVWGLGEISAAATLTYRQGAGFVGLALTGMTIFSEGYFPVAVFPDWIRRFAELNPLTAVMNGVREALLGGAGTGDLLETVLYVAPFSIVSLVVGSTAFGIALRRERKKGTLGQY